MSDSPRDNEGYDPLEDEQAALEQMQESLECGEDYEPEVCPHCGKEYEDFSDIGCGHCDRRSPEWGMFS